jgi:TolB-like protein/Tfp pilus assembly protein PilF
VVDAVNCAVEIQRELAERNTELPYKRQMQFRIGVNLGDVIEEDGRIYGDGVNIAARVESLAEAGGICISSRAYEQVMNKLGLKYEDLGEHQVKNISVPIRVYKVLSFPGAAAHRVAQAKESLGKRWRKIAISAVVLIAIVGGLAYWQFYMRSPDVEPASVEKMAFPLPEKPSIAVLPFVNMSGDPKQEYLSDGITEQITSTLSKVPSMFVISRTSTFAYKEKPVKVQQVSEELGVRYVLEGSVQRSEDRVRITAQLIDAIDGKHMWSQRYDRELKDIFKLQDEITLKIIQALQVKLTEGEQVNIWRKNSPSNIEYVEKLFEADFYLDEFNKESNIKAKKLFKEAIDLEPEHWMGYLGLAMTHNLDVWMGTSSSPGASLGKAFEFCKKAISLDEKQDAPHMVMGNNYLLIKKHDLAIKECQRAIALNPNSANGYVFLGQSLAYSGRPEEGIELIKKGMRLSPFPNNWYIHNLAIAYREAGRYEESIAEYKKGLKLRPNNMLAYWGMSVTYALAGRYEEAREAYSKVLEIDPKHSFEKGLNTFPYKPERIKIVRAAMQKAGLPYTPPLPLPDKPSIAVLAFDNLSGDPEQEYFSDGLSEEIINALSKTDQLFVIARNSSFTYKGKPVNVKQIAKELSVRYVLEGSVRKSGERVRITAQLIDASSGHHLWSERYDRDLKDIFAVQDEITMKIITALQIELSEGEQAKIIARGTENLEAYLKVVQGLQYFQRSNKETNTLAQKLAQEAISLDSSYPAAYLLLSKTQMREIILATSKSPKISIKFSIENAKKAISLDASLADAQAWLGWLYTMTRQFDKGIAAAERAFALNPNLSDTTEYLGLTLNYAGRHEEAIKMYKKAMRLSPIPSVNTLFSLCIAYRDCGRYEEGISAAKKAVHLQPDSLLAHTCLASCYALLGRDHEAKAESAEVLKIEPNFSVAYYEKRIPYKDPADTKLVLDSFRKAGLPE